MGIAKQGLVLGVSLAAAALVMTGLAQAGDRVGNIALESGISADQAQFLKRDRDVLQALRLKQDNAKLKALLGVSSLSSSELIQWLEDRVQAVVGQDFSQASHVGVDELDYSYEEPGVFPAIEHSDVKPTPGTGMVIMSNMGIGIYLRGKQMGNLLGIEIPGVGHISVSSPRAGIIQVGPALFTPKHPLHAGDANAMANSIPRLGTFFHESRHSDGNGRSLGFLHAVCPAGHDLQGLYACDRNLNGPYTVGATMIQAMAETCAQCTVADREALRLRYLENFGRVLPNTLDNKPVSSWDPFPEGRR